jgi:archaemetzincin
MSEKQRARSGTPSATERRLALMAVMDRNRADESLLQALVGVLRDAFGADVFTTGSIPLPAHAYIEARDQYRSTVLLDALVTHKKPDWDRLLGVTDIDLYTPDLNFVFGEADARRGVAVFSLARLHSADRARFVHRAATEAIHEIGHTYGLAHCDDPRCVMWFSNTLDETDRKGTHFCLAHAQAVGQSLRRRV